MGIASCRCAIKPQKSSEQGVVKSETLHWLQEKQDEFKKDERFPQDQEIHRDALLTLAAAELQIACAFDYWKEST